MRVPGFVVTEVDLNEIHPRLDEPPGHQERPAEGVTAVAIEQLRVSIQNVKCSRDLAVGQSSEIASWR